MSAATSLEVLQWSAIAALAVGLLAMTRVWVQAVESPQPLTRPLQIGDLAPPLLGVPFEAEKEHVLLFLTNDCLRCLDAANRFTAHVGDGDVELVGLFKTQMSLGIQGMSRIVDAVPDAFEAYRASVTPFVVIVDGRGRVAYMAPVGSERAVNAALVAVDGRVAGEKETELL